MIPGALDHLFVLLVIGLAFPIGGWWAYQAFLKRIERDGPAALVAEYQGTMVWLLGLGAATLGIWLWAGRPLAALGFVPPGGDGDFASAVAIGAGLALVVRPIAVALSASAAAGMRRQFGALEVFLPKTKEQLAWGIAVSLFAGMFEEIAYRGYLIAYFQAWLGDWGALATSSALFGAAHLYQGRQGILVTALLGGALGWVYLETGSLLLPVVLHALTNISSMVSAWIVLRPRAEAA